MNQNNFNLKNSNISLYNRYRPNCFLNLVGQKIINQVLINSINKNQCAHAHIFAGPRGTGKTSCARIFAKAVNCLNFQNDVCNLCENCNLINNNNTTDIIELDAASNNGVETIRELADNAYYLPINLKKKIYIIDEAHMLTTNAWNALLKIVEEPPEHVIFIFSTTEFEKIIPTIQSRCLKHYFFLFDKKLLVEQIKKVCALEEYTIEEKAAEKLAQIAAGSLRDGLSLLSQIMIFTSKKIKLQNILEALFLVDNDTKIKLLHFLFNQDLINSLKLFEQLYHEGYQLQVLLNDLIAILLDLWVYQKTKDETLLEVVSIGEIQELKYDHISLNLWINILEKASFNLKHTKNNFLVIKVALINLFHQSHFLLTPNSSLINQTKKNLLETSNNLFESNLKQNLEKKQFQKISNSENLNLYTINQLNNKIEKKEKLNDVNIYQKNNKNFIHNPNLFVTKTMHINNPQILNALENVDLDFTNITKSNQQIQKDFNNKLDNPIKTDDIVINVIDEINDDFKSEENLILWTLKNLDKETSDNIYIKIQNVLKDKKNFINTLIENLGTKKEFVLASKQTVLLSFNKLTEALKFNEVIKSNSDFLFKINECFDTKMYWVGIHANKLKEWLQIRNTKNPIPVSQYNNKKPEKLFNKIVNDFTSKKEK